MPHPTSRRWLEVTLLTGALLAVLAAARASAEAMASPPPQAAGAAEFLKQSGLQGRTALIQFGAVGCQLSDEGIGKMTALSKDHKIDGLAFARVEAGDKSKDSEDYFAAKAPGFPVYYDAGSALAGALDATVFPTYVLVDRFGRVRYRGPWPDEAKLAQWVGTLGRQTSDAGPDAAMFGVAVLDVPRLLDETRLPGLDSTTESLRDRMGPKGLLAVFVDTTCPFSATAINDLPSVASVFAAQEIKSVLVNIGEAKAAVEEFYSKRQLDAPVMYDEGKATQTAWAITFVPTVVMIDSTGDFVYSGKAVWADVGAATEKSLKLAAGSLMVTPKGTGKG